MLKVSDSDYAYRLLPSLSNGHKDFAKFYWDYCNFDYAMGIFGLRLKDKQIDDGFYRLTVVDPKKWMLAVLKFQFEIN